jgi:glycosyltransferase involved in cell wall biosynthesis
VAGRCVAVVPAWRARATLAATLAALLDDNADSVERVVVVGTAADVADSEGAFGGRVRALVQSERRSAGAARNRGALAFPDSEYLLFCDADCRPEPGVVGRLLDVLEAEGLAATAASVVDDRPGVVSTLRHLLEFKEAEGPAHVRSWFVPSATLVLRRSAWESVGGFPDLWPGEDLVLCARLAHRGLGYRRVVEAVTRHRHPPGLLRALAHQWALGRASARARAMEPMPGSGWSTRPWLAPALAPARLLRLWDFSLRQRRDRLPAVLALTPLLVVALTVWSAGYAWGARRG